MIWSTAVMLAHQVQDASDSHKIFLQSNTNSHAIETTKMWKMSYELTVILKSDITLYYKLTVTVILKLLYFKQYKKRFPHPFLHQNP